MVTKPARRQRRPEPRQERLALDAYRPRVRARRLVANPGPANYLLRHDRLKAERKQLQKRVERHNKDDEVAYRFVTTLENHLGRDGVIDVKDRIPVSDDERIEIALDDETTTAGAATDPNEPGILTWKVPVPKDARREIFLVYRVRAPRGVVVAGLE